MKTRLFIATLLTLLSIGVLFVPAPRVSAALFDNAKDEACNGIALQGAGGAGCADAKGGVNGVLKTGINLFSLVVAIVAVIMIIVGGLKYITSQGDSTAISSAKNTIIYAIIGLVIVAFSQIIVRFALRRTQPVCGPGQTVNCTPATP
jgi:ABC-type Fe3+ transport system permease subunit